MPRVEFYCGEVMPMQRPRRAKDGHFYVPEETKACKRMIAVLALEARNKAGIFAPTRANVDLDCRVKVRGRGDLDNAVKTIQDAIQGVLIWDDAQIWRISATRREKKYPTLPGEESTVAIEWEDSSVLREKVKAKK